MTATESTTEVHPAERPVDAPASPIPAPLPLQPEDPPRVGEFWLRGRLGANAAGYLYTASDEHGRHAVVAMMTEGSADDAAARDRFVHAVDSLPEDVVLAHNDEDDDDLALWAAFGPIREDDGSSAAADERLLAERRGEDVLSAVLMDRIPQHGRRRGPDFRHYWEGRRRPGLFRIWPLPWPTASKPASWAAIWFALATMLLIMALALLTRLAAVQGLAAAQPAAGDPDAVQDGHHDDHADDTAAGIRPVLVRRRLRTRPAVSRPARRNQARPARPTRATSSRPAVARGPSGGRSGRSG